MNAVIPVLIWLIPKVALGGIVFSSGMLLTVFGAWILDIRREGPKVRAFQSLHPRMQECAKSLSSYYGSSPKGLERPILFGRANVQAATLLLELRRLDIATPRFPHANDYDAVHYVLSYLASVEILAEQGRLMEARKMTIDAKWEYKEPNSG